MHVVASLLSVCAVVRGSSACSTVKDAFQAFGFRLSPVKSAAFWDRHHSSTQYQDWNDGGASRRRTMPDCRCHILILPLPYSDIRTVAQSDSVFAIGKRLSLFRKGHLL